MNRLYNYLNKNKFFYNHRLDLEKDYSTTLTLMEVIDSIYSHLDKHESIIIGNYLDVQKAFDYVNHKMLLKI